MSDSNPLTVSFEFFPPKTEKLEAQLWEAVTQLARLQPSFVSVTYGAGGSTRTRTHQIVETIQAKTGIPAAAHLTCVAASRAEIDAIADEYWDAGIRHIVALRGDPPGGMDGAYEPQADGYAYASDLIMGLKKRHDFEISCAAYPEGHPQALSADADLENLKRKINAGATRAITQFFFDAGYFLRFRDRAAAAGITVPIVPGILPVLNFKRAKEFAASCGATIPPAFAAQFENIAEDDTMKREAIAILAATDMCRTLESQGVREFHFYTLNRAELTEGVCRLLGVESAELV